MRKFVFPFLLGVMVTSGLAFKTVYDLKKNSAEVYESSEFNGLSVFWDSKPLMPHDTIGQVESRSLSTNYFKERDNLLKRCNQTYPKADGIIFNTNPKTTTRAWVIQFKK